MDIIPPDINLDIALLDFGTLYTGNTVTYRPADVGRDDGFQETSSDDPDDPMVELGLTGSGEKMPVPIPIFNLVDLDIHKFKVTKKVKLFKEKLIRIRLDIKNNGEFDEPRQATVIGTQNGFEIYNKSMPVNDPVGGGKTKWYFPEMSFIPEVDGDIIWTVTIIDDDVDIDEAKAKAVVKKRPEDDNREDDHLNEKVEKLELILNGNWGRLRTMPIWDTSMKIIYFLFSGLRYMLPLWYTT